MIFIFSDDILWCKEHFTQYLDSMLYHQVEFVFVEGNDEGNAIPLSAIGQRISSIIPISLFVRLYALITIHAVTYRIIYHIRGKELMMYGAHR